jgi:two-component system, NarL family, response regulator
MVDRLARERVRRHDEDRGRRSSGRTPGNRNAVKIANVASQIRLIVADDHAIFRQGLKSLLGLQEDFGLVAEIDRAADLWTTIESTPCDLLVLDLQMDRWVGDEIAELSRRVPVLVLTASERIEDAMLALRAGARGVVQKRFAFETLIEAIRAVITGMVWVPPVLQAQLVANLTARVGQRLTDRESEIVRYVATGLRNAEVAQRLAITEGTVKTHLNNIFQKLGVRDRVELTHYALREGLIGLSRGGR